MSPKINDNIKKYYMTDTNIFINEIMSVEISNLPVRMRVNVIWYLQKSTFFLVD